jgi:hypothetical protein
MNTLSLSILSALPCLFLASEQPQQSHCCVVPVAIAFKIVRQELLRL